MTPPESTLAALLRVVQWRLDEVAFDLPAGRSTVEQRAELAEALEQLAAVVRATLPHDTNSNSTNSNSTAALPPTDSPRHADTRGE